MLTSQVTHATRPVVALSPAGWLAARITARGLPVTALRPAALIELAAQLPPSFLASMVGISPGTAVRWNRAAGAGWASYAAVRAGSAASREGR